MDLGRKNVVYYFDDMIGTYHYATGHPMKPMRIAMTDEIVRTYGLQQHFDTVVVAFTQDLEYAQMHGTAADEAKLTAFHSDEYIELIRTVTPENKGAFEDQLYRFNFKDDCPVMERLYDYCVSYTSGSIGEAAHAAVASLVGSGQYQYGINWSGGLHHAKQSEASGFCYVNDCVLAILELLKTYQRVLYVDIDIHHGDGVEEAFYLTDRVMTCSFHKFRDYFPGTGHIDDIGGRGDAGKERGVYRSVNFPLDEGLDDESFQLIFEAVISKIMANYQPEAVLLQSGTDSLSGDKLGCFNLSVRGHGTAAAFLKKFNVPVLFFGGGGYTLRNVPRCWAYETSVVCGVEIANEIPQNEYSVYFAPEYKLHMPVSNMENQNSKAYLERTIEQISRNLDNVSPSGVQLNVNGSAAPARVDVAEVIRRRRDLWETANIDKSNDPTPE